MTFWIGGAQLPWVIVGILTTVIGVTGIKLIFSERRTKVNASHRHTVPRNALGCP
jgi:hypothetical protein